MKEIKLPNGTYMAFHTRNQHGKTYATVYPAGKRYSWLKVRVNNLPHKSYDLVSGMMRWHFGELDEQQEIELFQNLVNTGLAWKFEASISDRAKKLLDDGEILSPFQVID